VAEGGIGRIGFVGIGAMGWPMARRLVTAGFDVAVHDRDHDRVRRFTREVGGRAAFTVEEVSRGEVLITMLPTSREVEAVLMAAQPGLEAGAVVIDMSSGEPAVTRRLAETLAARGVGMLDCPVSGGVSRAESGELALLAGGPAELLERLRPLLMAMGSSLHHCGPVGAGQAMKALNNLVSAAGFLAGIEALAIGQKFGLDPALMVDVLNASTGMNNSTQKKFKQFVLSRRFDSGFGLDLMVKDLTIALGLGRAVDAPAPFAALCRELWAAAAHLLGPGQDHTALAKMVERQTGARLGEGE
jgi:3-hydroxyisobutyrate dehydrogenase